MGQLLTVSLKTTYYTKKVSVILWPGEVVETSSNESSLNLNSGSMRESQFRKEICVVILMAMGSAQGEWQHYERILEDT